MFLFFNYFQPSFFLNEHFKSAFFWDFYLFWILKRVDFAGNRYRIQTSNNALSCQTKKLGEVDLETGSLRNLLALESEKFPARKVSNFPESPRVIQKFRSLRSLVNKGEETEIWWDAPILNHSRKYRLVEVFSHFAFSGKLTQASKR